MMREIIDTAEGAVCCVRCHKEHDKPYRVCFGGCWGYMSNTPIQKRIRRGKEVDVPARWVGAFTTKKTLRDRKSIAKAKRLKVRIGKQLVTKAALRRQARADSDPTAR